MKIEPYSARTDLKCMQCEQAFKKCIFHIKLKQAPTTLWKLMPIKRVFY